MIIIDLSIILIIILLCYLLKDIKKILNISSIITIIFGYIILFLAFIFNKIIKNNLSFINANKISSIIVSKFINRGLILILIGGIELIIYTIVRLKKRINVKQ